MSEIKKIAGIKEELQAAEEGMLPAFILKYEADQRAGIEACDAGKKMSAGVAAGTTEN